MLEESLESTESKRRGRKPTTVTPEHVRDLRASSNRITWEDIGRRLRIAASTARKLWYQIPAAERRRFKPTSTRPKWYRTRLKKDPILNTNLWGQTTERMKKCELKDVGLNKVWACKKIKPLDQFHQASLKLNGVYLRSLCKDCERRRREFGKRIERVLVPKITTVKKPKGRPPKVTQMQVDFLVAQGMTDMQIAEHCKVSYSTAKRVRLKSTQGAINITESDWSSPEMYKKKR